MNIIHRFIVWLCRPILEALAADVKTSWSKIDALADDQRAAARQLQQTIQGAPDPEPLLAEILQRIEHLKTDVGAVDKYCREVMAATYSIVGTLPVEFTALGDRNSREVIDFRLEQRDQIQLLQAKLDSLPRYDSTLYDILGEIRLSRQQADRVPSMSLNLLMAWEAVAYAAQKYDKDTDQHGITDRTKEVLAWAYAYLCENDWPAPGRDVLATLLTMYDRISKVRLVNKYQ